MTTDAILNQIRRLGYIVKIFRVNGTVEMHAVPLKGDGEPQVARCNDGEDDESAYRAACLLAEAVGVELEDGRLRGYESVNDFRVSCNPPFLSAYWTCSVRSTARLCRLPLGLSGC